VSLWGKPRIFITRSVSLEDALFEIPGGELVENKGHHHNPKRERGIPGHAVELPKLNPSLTFRVVVNRKRATSKIVSQGLHLAHFNHTHA